MTLTIDVSLEFETKIEEEATRNGLSKNDFVRIMLEEKLNFKRQNELSKTPFQSRIIAINLPIKDRSLEYEWLAKNRDEFDGKYVALDGNELVAIGENFKDASSKARELGRNNALIVLVEGSDTPPFLGGIW